MTAAGGEKKVPRRERRRDGARVVVNVCLPQGALGKEQRARIAELAAESGVSVSLWARRAILAAAGFGSSSATLTERVAELERRVESLEDLETRLGNLEDEVSSLSEKSEP